MHTNPFDDDDGMFSVVVNDEEQHSLWHPGRGSRGLRKVFGEATRAECLDYVERNWTDIRPRSLREVTSAG